MYSILDKSDKSEFMTGYGFNIKVWDEDCFCVSDESKVEFIKNHGVSILKENDVYDKYLKASNSGKIDIIDALEVDEQKGFWAVFASVVTNETGCLICYVPDDDNDNTAIIIPYGAPWSYNDKEKEAFATPESTREFFKPWFEEIGIEEPVLFNTISFDETWE